jgi:hypothetical protein
VRVCQFRHTGIIKVADNIDLYMEAATGFEPVIRVLQTRALPLGYAANKFNGAEDGIRTRDPHLGKVVFYH